jgi:hypothetical protein
MKVSAEFEREEAVALPRDRRRLEAAEVTAMQEIQKLMVEVRW